MTGIARRILDLKPTPGEFEALTRILRGPAAATGPDAIAEEIADELPRIAIPLNSLLGLSTNQWAKLVPLLIATLSMLYNLAKNPGVGAGIGLAGATVAAALALRKDKTPDQERRERNLLAEAVVDEQDRRRKERNAAKRRRKAQRHGKAQ